MATKQQIPVLAARLVEFQEGFSDLPNEDAQWAIMHAKEAVQLCANAIKNRPRESQSVFRDIIFIATIPAATEQFVARENFIIDTSNNAKVKISCLDSYFELCFISKVENPFPGSLIVARQLIKSSVDAPILKELGGNEKAETMLTEIYAMMRMQADGKKDGDLLTDGCANIFYVKDITNTLRAVHVSWHVDGWRVDAYSIEGSSEWHVGHRVFSHNPLAA